MRKVGTPDVTHELLLFLFDVVIESSVDSRSRSEDCVAGGGGGISHAQSIG